MGAVPGGSRTPFDSYGPLDAVADWDHATRTGTETPFAQRDEVTAAQANFPRKATETLLGK